jgi:hypothetical protein
VKNGLLSRSLEGIQAVGVDEIQWQKGHHYLTLVYQIEAGGKRLLWSAPRSKSVSAACKSIAGELHEFYARAGKGAFIENRRKFLFAQAIALAIVLTAQ